MNTCPKCRRGYPDGVRFCPADGSLVAQVVDPYLGRVLMKQFRLVAFAGRGAMGTVYRAEQVNVGRTVAVKVLRGDLLKDDSAVKRFLREAQAAARLSHPNIVAVHLVGESDDGVPFIVMEYVEGQTLGALTEKLGVMEPRRALRLVRQIGSALTEAHTQGIVHRDLKAENILLAERARTRSQGGDVVKVLDFGIAKLLGGEGGEIAQLTRDGTIFGTPHYIAPEQASGQDVDGRADLYSLGVILFRLVTGRLPFDGASGMQVLMRHVRELPPRPRDLRPEIHESLEALILTALEKNREHRFADAERFIAAIDKVEAHLGDAPGQTLLGLKPVKPLTPAVAPRAAEAGSTLKVTAVAPASTTDAFARAAVIAQRDAEPDDPTATRAGETGLNTWSARAPAAGEIYEEDLYPPPPRRRGLWLGLAGAALFVGAGALLLWLPKGKVTPPPAPIVAGKITPPAPAAPPPVSPTPLAAPVSPTVAPAPAPAPVVDRAAPLDGPRVTHLRHPSAFAGAGHGRIDTELDMPVTIIPGETEATEPIVPHALGPAPDTVPPRPAPQGRPAPPKRPEAPPPAVDESDPYQMLREAK